MGEIIVRHNRYMKKILLSKKEFKFENSIYNGSFFYDIKQVDDFYLLQNNSDVEFISPISVDHNTFFDQTGYECFFNKIHVEDFINNNESDLFFWGMKLISTLIETLQKKFPAVKFRIILSFVVEDSCTVRFHKIRENQSWLDTNIDNYLHEGILDIVLES